MRLFPCRAGRCLLACVTSLILLAGCGGPSETFSLSEAGAMLKASLAARPDSWSFQERMNKDDYAKNKVLQEKIEKMIARGLLQRVSEGQDWVIRLTARGDAFRMSPEPGKPEVKGEVIVRTGNRVLDRIDSVGELQTNQGARVRDTLYTWHYSEVTPFGEVLGLKASEPQQSKFAAVLFGDGWRFVEQ